MLTTPLIVIYLFSLLKACKDWRKIEVRYGKMVPTVVGTFYGGSYVTLHCGSASPVSWTYEPYSKCNIIEERRLLGDRYRSNNFSIKLYDLQPDETGFYHCLGYSVNNEAFNQFALVIVVDAVDYGSVLPSRVEVVEGGTVTLICGSIKPAAWIHIDQTIEYEIEGSNTLLLKNLKKEHSGRLLCRGINVQKEVFHKFALIIVEPVIKIIH